jgi:DNA polymerase III subunit epsilon
MSTVIIIAVIVVIAILLLKGFDKIAGRGPKQAKDGVKEGIESYISLLPEQFAVVDIETTGLEPERHEIIEIGAVKANRESDVHETFSALIRPEKKVSNKIAELTGITNEMLEREGKELESAMTEFLTFVGDLRLVYYNAPFDHAFLTKAASLSGKKIENPVSCALDMSRRAWPGQKSYKLANLAAKGGLTTNGTHRALKDCQLTMIVYTAAATTLGRIS